MDLISQHLFSILKTRIQIGKLQQEKHLLKLNSQPLTQAAT